MAHPIQPKENEHFSITDVPPCGMPQRESAQTLEATLLARVRRLLQTFSVGRHPSYSSADEGAAQVHHAGPDGRERRGQRVEPSVGANFLFCSFSVLFCSRGRLKNSREKLKITLVHNSERSTRILHLT